MDSDTAARLLRVSRATLYAYASRGLIQTEPDPINPRRRLYRAADIQRLRTIKERGRSPRAIAAAALDWGTGTLPSRVTLLAAGRLSYRGQNAVQLAGHASLEDVARLLWACEEADPFAKPPPDGVGARRFRGAPPIDRCRALLSLAPSSPLALAAREPAALAIEAGGLLRIVAAALLGVPPSIRPIHKQLAARWRLNRNRADLLRAVLVLLADHELNASTFAVRVVASTGAPLAACISAGLAALSGPRHGGATGLVEGLLDEAERTGDPGSVIASRGGRPAPGFGHPLYPDGDPRAEFILDRLPANPIRTGLIEAVAAVTDQKPNVDFALASLSRAYALPPQSSLVMFAAARTAGWIAHAFEQRADARLIRPRAVYVGVPPLG